jgi:hypothetical protein
VVFGRFGSGGWIGELKEMKNEWKIDGVLRERNIGERLVSQKVANCLLTRGIEQQTAHSKQQIINNNKHLARQTNHHRTTNTPSRIASASEKAGLFYLNLILLIASR